MKRKIFLGLVLYFLSLGLFTWYFVSSKAKPPVFNGQTSIVISSPSPIPAQITIPSEKILSNGDYHIFQTFNNCGPAALSMALRFYGISVSQQELGQSLRPYQIPTGDNDDKSVTLEELAKKSEEYGFTPIHRPMGNPQIVKQFIAEGLPVIARTLTKPNEDIGHYRVIKGYDEVRGIFIQDDSLQNKNLEFSYDEFNILWKRFNYEYLVLVPKDKNQTANAILGEGLDPKIAWQSAVKNSEGELLANPNDIYARFNLSVALYNVGSYQRSVQEFEKVENLLPFRTLWYQIEPIQAYFELGNYDRVFQITDRILNNYNRAFSELYILRGKSYLKQGQTESARQEFEKAVFYNNNLSEAQNLLNSI